MKPTTANCAHYDDGISDHEAGMFSVKVGTCLFNQRDWSPHCTPQRCADCPAGAKAKGGEV